MRKNTQRILALAGMTLAAGAAAGMTSTAAFAADSGSTAVAPHGPGGDHHDGPGDHHNGPGDHHDGNNWGNGNSWGNGNDWNRDWTRTVGYYRSARTCTTVGIVGEHRGQWDTFRCVPVNHGHTWALVASSHHGHGHH